MPVTPTFIEGEDITITQAGATDATITTGTISSDVHMVMVRLIITDDGDTLYRKLRHWLHWRRCNPLLEAVLQHDR